MPNFGLVETPFAHHNNFNISGDVIFPITFTDSRVSFYETSKVDIGEKWEIKDKIRKTEKGK